jgi:hypothetical protein
VSGELIQMLAAWNTRPYASFALIDKKNRVSLAEDAAS